MIVFFFILLRIPTHIKSFLRFKLKLVIFDYLKILKFFFFFKLLNSGILFLSTIAGFYSLQCLPLCPLCTLTPAIPNEPITTLPYLNQPPNESQLNQTPPPPTLIIPEPDQRVGRGFKWMGVCWFRCGGQLTQVGRGDSARGVPEGQVGRGGGVQV